MDTYEAIKGRRSIRRFQAKEIDRELLERLLDAIRWSPSWANTQCWEVVVVRDPSLKEALRGTLPGTNPANKAMVEAPLVFVLCARLGEAGYYKGQVTTKFGDWFMYDIGIATQSLCLMGHALGLGSVIVGLFDHNRAREILNVPDGVEVVSMIPIGYPAHEATPPKRRDVGEFVHWDRY
ncbi:MAG: nitroreductase family protein [Desulfatiglandales bacterium]